MRILLFVIPLSVFFLVINVEADAGFHGTGLICNKCHTMHYSEDGGIPPGADAGGPFDYLLLKEYSTDLCLMTCHADGQGGQGDTPDVSGDDSNGLSERAAGFFADVDVINPNGHNLAANYVTTSPSVCLPCHWDFLGGDFNTLKIGCLDCHDAHGWAPGSPNYSYRNLVRKRHSAEGAPKIKAFVNPGAGGIDVYEQENIGYGAPDTPTSAWREVTNVCFPCHYYFSGYGRTREGGVADGICLRHPNTDSERGAWEAINKHVGSTDPVHWESGTGIGFEIDRLRFIVKGANNYTESKTVAQENEVFCLTCHKPHGSANNSALHWDYRNNSNLGCQQCHNKGN